MASERENRDRYMASLIAVADNKCPVCGGELDTGWECNGCGKDCQPLIRMVNDELKRACNA